MLSVVYMLFWLHKLYDTSHPTYFFFFFFLSCIRCCLAWAGVCARVRYHGGEGKYLKKIHFQKEYGTKEAVLWTIISWAIEILTSSSSSSTPRPPPPPSTISNVLEMDLEWNLIEIVAHCRSTN